MDNHKYRFPWFVQGGQKLPNPDFELFLAGSDASAPKLLPPPKQSQRELDAYSGTSGRGERCYHQQSALTSLNILVSLQNVPPLDKNGCWWS